MLEQARRVHIERRLPAVSCTLEPAPVADARPDAWHRVGQWLLINQPVVRATQWGVVGVYLLLLIIPATLPLADRHAHIWDNLVLFAQFVFWGLWWPFVLVSTVLIGRAWCGLFCPEGALTEFASRHGRAHAIPHWIKWGGWPFVAFATTTVYGQMVSVYQYPRPALLILGGSTVAAILVGASYGRGKRVWCRFLCPVSGVFGLLSKLAPLHFKVDPMAWSASQHAPKRRIAPVNCPPLVAIRTMRGASQCHMCGRCSGFRGAVSLSRRSPNDEIINVAGRTPHPWETVLIVLGMTGVAAGAFQWSASPWFVAAKQVVAHWLVAHGIIWPLEATAPWWLLTNYPDHNDVLTLLDGALLLAYIATVAITLSVSVVLLLALATRALGRWSWPRFHHLAQSLIPLAGCGIFLGLSSLTVTLLRAEGFRLDWIDSVRIALIAGASLWSLWLAAFIGRRYAKSGLRQIASLFSVAMAVAIANSTSILMFWIW